MQIMTEFVLLCLKYICLKIEMTIDSIYTLIELKVCMEVACKHGVCKLGRW